MKRKHQLRALLLGAAASLVSITGNLSAQSITYQGVLSERGQPASGPYEFKFQFRQPGPPPILFDPPIELPVEVLSGRFTALLDVRDIPFQDSGPLELVICVRRPGENEYVPLDPPQLVTPAPRAIAADSVSPDGLPDTVIQTNVPPIFSVPITGPELLLADPNGIVRFGGGECTIGVDPALPGLNESDPFGFRLLGRGGEGCRLIFGANEDCTIEIAPPGGDLPDGLLLRDPRIRILPPDGSPPLLLFGPTDDCSLGIDPEFSGLVERDPVGFRLLGRDSQGCRLLFGPDDLCTVEINPQGPPGLLLRDPRGIRVLDPQVPENARLFWGPTDDCSIGLDPELTGLVERDPVGFRLMGPGGQGCRLIFGPTMDCTVEVLPEDDPNFVTGLLLRDPRGVRLLPPVDPTGVPFPPRLIFGPTDDCTLGIDPTGELGGLLEQDPIGFRLLGQNLQGCRLLFGPTDDCTVEVSPPGAGPSGLILRDPRGIRVLNPDPQLPPRILWGPTDDCSIGLEPGLSGLVERDPTGFRLMGRNNQGCRLIFGPTLDCTVEVDPQGPPGLLLRDPRGIRVLSPDPQVGPTLRFGPTDDCSLGIDPELPGLIERDPTGFRLLGQDSQGCRLIFGPTLDCTVEVDPKGPPGLLLRDPRGIRILNPDPQAQPQLLFGETGDCAISAGSPNQEFGMIFVDPRGFLFQNALEPGTAQMLVDGTLRAQKIEQISSRRLKDNVQPLENALEKIERLQGVSFDWKPEQGGQPAIGFIAEEVGEVIPEVVTYEEDGVNARGVNYGHLVAVTVEGIKAQQNQIETLEQENVDLKDGLKAMQAQMERLAAQVEALRSTQ